MHSGRAGFRCVVRAHWRSGRRPEREPARSRKATDDRDDLPFQVERPCKASSIGPLSRPSPRDADVPAGRITGGRDLSPWLSGCPARTTPMKRSRNNACARTSGPVVFPTTPVSRSTLPSRSGALSLFGFCTKRSRTPGASSPTRAIRSGPKLSTKPSLVRSVNVRTSCFEVELLGRA